MLGKIRDTAEEVVVLAQCVPEIVKDTVRGFWNLDSVRDHMQDMLDPYRKEEEGDLRKVNDTNVIDDLSIQKLNMIASVDFLSVTFDDCKYEVEVDVSANEADKQTLYDGTIIKFDENGKYAGELRFSIRMKDGIALIVWAEPTVINLHGVTTNNFITSFLHSYKESTS